MDRRTFIKTSGLASTYLLIPDFLKPMEHIATTDTERNLVVVQLSGGNDWLNTIVPFGNDEYFKKRTKLSLNNDKITLLSQLQGINNSLLPLKELYDEGNWCIVNNVGYPNPDRSHFRSMDIWQSASGSNEYRNTGWIGRYLDSNCKDSYQAIETDNNLSLALKGDKLKGMAVKDIKKLIQQTKLPYFKTITDVTKPENLTEDNQGYLYKTLIQTCSSADYIFETSIKKPNAYDYPDNDFGKQLKNVATFINSGLKTKVYYVSLTGFDTHVNQLNQQNRLLKIYADGISAFVKHLKITGRWDDTLIFTFSEFGRRVEENASAGTDHGTAGNVFLFGNKLKKKGIANEAPDLLDLADGDLKYKIDFRSVYANILNSWLAADASQLIGNVAPYELV